MQLSILIPAGNEMFLKNTIEDILKNIEADTEIIATLDGNWADPPIEDHPRVTLIYVPQPIGQRAATNLACKLAKGKYVMKLDAHCAVDKGFDRKMLEAFEKVGDNVTLVPIMKNLWAFDIVCRRCKWRKYQDAMPKRCEKCNDSRYLRREIKWVAKERPQSVSYCFDSGPHFQYFTNYRGRSEYQEGIKTGFTETMSIQGSCFMLTKEKYWELNVSDEEFGSWGNQGIEVACKTWLSGGRVLINHNTWYGHLFRTHSGFAFPWGNRESQVQVTKKNVWEAIVKKQLPRQIHPVSWLIEKFWPVTSGSKEDWTPEKLEELKSLEKSC